MPLLAGALSVLLSSPGCVGAYHIPREPLDKLWDEHMLRGTGAEYLNAHQTSFVATRPVEYASGSPGLAEMTVKGILVRAYRDDPLGLDGSGWALGGGLLQAVIAKDTTVELYGKEIVHIQRSGTYRFGKDKWYEFFLLLRPTGASQATILNKWIIPPEDVLLKDEPYNPQYKRSDVRGALRYDAATKTAIVTVTGLTREFEERVDLSTVLRE